MTKKLLKSFIIVNLLFCSLSMGQQSRRPKRNSIPPAQKIPPINFCDLTVHPERYVGKLVRVKASIVSWWESSYLYHVRCETAEKKIHNGLDCSGEEECQRIGKEAYGYIERRQQPDSDNYAFRAYVTLIGRLEGPSEVGYGHLNSFKFEFKIRQVETASPMPSKIPYRN